MKAKISTIDYLIECGKEMLKEYNAELNRAVFQYGAESKQVSEIEKKLVRVIRRLDELTSTDDVRGICI